MQDIWYLQSESDTEFISVSDDLRSEAKKINSSDLLPVTVFDARVTDRCKEGQVLLELVYLDFEAFGHTARSRHIS